MFPQCLFVGAGTQAWKENITCHEMCQKTFDDTVFSKFQTKNVSLSWSMISEITSRFCLSNQKKVARASRKNCSSLKCVHVIMLRL